MDILSCTLFFFLMGMSAPNFDLYQLNPWSCTLTSPVGITKLWVDRGKVNDIGDFLPEFTYFSPHSVTGSLTHWELTLPQYVSRIFAHQLTSRPLLTQEKYQGQIRVRTKQILFKENRTIKRPGHGIRGHCERSKKHVSEWMGPGI